MFLRHHGQTRGDRPSNKPLQRTGLPQGNRIESSGQLGGNPAAERQGVRQTAICARMFSPVWSHAMATFLGFALSPQARLRSGRSAFATFTLGLLQVLSLSSLLSCAATKSGDHALSQKSELQCGNDDDCVVLESDFSDCCGADGRYPYVLSHRAADQMTSLWETRCRGVPCGEMLYSRSGPRASDFVAVCSRHICEMKPKEVRPKWQLPE